jgi:hypothetical protein
MVEYYAPAQTQGWGQLEGCAKQNSLDVVISEVRFLASLVSNGVEPKLPKPTKRFLVKYNFCRLFPIRQVAFVLLPSTDRDGRRVAASRFVSVFPAMLQLHSSIYHEGPPGLHNARRHTERQEIQSCSAPERRKVLFCASLEKPSENIAFLKFDAADC